jgi:hypothetical protein
MTAPKKIRARRARAKQRPRGRDLRSRYREGDLPDPGGLAVVTIDDPFPSLEIGAKLEQVRHPDGSTAEGAPGWTSLPRQRGLIASWSTAPAMPIRRSIPRGTPKVNSTIRGCGRGARGRTGDLARTEIAGKRALRRLELRIGSALIRTL